VRYYPDLKIMLARLYRIQGDSRRASSIAESGLGIFGRRVEKDPDSVTDRVQWARLLTFRGDFERAVLVLQDGAARLHAKAVELPKRESEDDLDATLDQLRFELSNTLIVWHDSLRRESPHDYAARLRVLQLAVNAVPTDRRVLERLALLTTEGRHSATDAREALSDALADGTAPATVHLLLSLTAQNHHDRQAEERHLRLALALNPRLAAAANNLAWLLAHDDRPDLDAALTLIQQAAAVAPNHPEIRATRGVIYRKMGRTEEAIVDLETALVSLRHREDLHGELAGLYETLGELGLAERHRRRAISQSASGARTAG
jgi:Tfp pilus assembly protein PilF